MASFIYKSDFDHEEVDSVVGIGRGGLPVATLASYLLKVDMDVVWATYDDDPEYDPRIDLYGFPNVDQDDQILLVDDYVITGETMSSVREIIEANPSTERSCDTLALYAASDEKSKEPDHFLYEVPRENIPIMPWRAGEILNKKSDAQ